MGQDDSMVIVVNGHLPSNAANYTVAATPNALKLKAGWDVVAEIKYANERVFDILTRSSQVGLVEYEPPNDVFPASITKIAYVQTSRPQ
jgi:hypothetical protein